jgi:hypothetical protein
MQHHGPCYGVLYESDVVLSRDHRHTVPARVGAGIGSQRAWINVICISLLVRIEHFESCHTTYVFLKNPWFFRFR